MAHDLSSKKTCHMEVYWVAKTFKRTGEIQDHCPTPVKNRSVNTCEDKNTLNLPMLDLNTVGLCPRFSYHLKMSCQGKIYLRPTEGAFHFPKSVYIYIYTFEEKM